MATNNMINQRAPHALCFAYLSATSAAITGDNTAVNIPFNAVLFDETSSFDTGTHLYTAPATGTYLACTNLQCNNMSDKPAFVYEYFINGTIHQTVRVNASAATVAGNFSWNHTLAVSLNVGNQIWVRIAINGGAKDVCVVSGGANDPKSWMSIYIQ